MVLINFIINGLIAYTPLILVSLKGADPLILVKISLFLLENSLHVWGHYVLNFYKAIATRNAPKKGPKNGGFR